MKKAFAILLACNIIFAHADELKSFDAISKSVEAGNNIKLVIHFDLCSPKPPMADMIIYTTPTAILMLKDHLQFANSPLTTNDPAFANKPILENVTYRITNDAVNITMKMITLPDYVIHSEYTHTVVCPLGTAVKIFN